MTISALLEQGQQALNNSESASLDAQILLCKVLKVDRSYLYRSPEKTVPHEIQEQFLSCLEQRRRGIPVSHLTGHREFWSLDLKVNEHTLIPRPETEQLVEAALDIIRTHDVSRILDLGTGSGAIAIAIATELSKMQRVSQITATDISDLALTVAQENIQRHNLKNIRLIQGDWYQSVVGQSFDLIVSNPPYIASQHPCLQESDVQHEPLLALSSGMDGLDAIHILITHAPDHLNHKGWLIFEHGYDQKIAAQQLLNNIGFQNICTLNDFAGHDRITLGQWKK